MCPTDPSYSRDVRDEGSEEKRTSSRIGPNTLLDTIGTLQSSWRMMLDNTLLAMKYSSEIVHDVPQTKIQLGRTGTVQLLNARL